MHQIRPHQLWVGTIGDLHDWKKLYDLGLRAVIQLAYEEQPMTLPHDFISCRFPLVDGGDNPLDTLELAVSTLTHCLEQKFASIVCCRAGMSRSPAVAAAALARLTRQPLTACLELISQAHHCDVHAGLITQLQALERLRPELNP